MSDLTERKFGYMMPPPPPPHHCHDSGHLSTNDLMQYINSYMDIRARQIYDKLKGTGNGQGDTVSFNQILGQGEKTTQIATVTVNGQSTTLYAPSRTEVEVTATKKEDFELPKLAGTITVDGVKNEIYCEESGKIIFDALTEDELDNTSINIATITLSDDPNDAKAQKIQFYAPQAKVVNAVTKENGVKIADIQIKKVVEKKWSEENGTFTLTMETVNQPIYAPKQSNELDEIILKNSKTNKKYRIFVDDNGNLCSEEEK